jgi:hypothetical protein
LVVERSTFAWFGRNRRLDKNLRTAETLATFVTLASVHRDEGRQTDRERTFAGTSGNDEDAPTD